MTPFLLLWSAVCGFTVVSYVAYITDRDPKNPDDKHVFWHFGNFYDKFFFNHGEYTAGLPPPDKHHPTVPRPEDPIIDLPTSDGDRRGCPEKCEYKGTETNQWNCAAAPEGSVLNVKVTDRFTLKAFGDTKTYSCERTVGGRDYRCREVSEIKPGNVPMVYAEDDNSMLQCASSNNPTPIVLENS